MTWAEAFFWAVVVLCAAPVLTIVGCVIVAVVAMLVMGVAAWVMDRIF